jgi:hypothetical protein
MKLISPLRGLAVLALALLALPVQAVIIAESTGYTSKYHGSGTIKITFAWSDWVNGIAQIEQSGPGPFVDPNYFGFPGFYIYMGLAHQGPNEGTYMMRTRWTGGEEFTSATWTGDTDGVPWLTQYMDIHWEGTETGGVANGVWGYSNANFVPDATIPSLSLLLALGMVFTVHRCRSVRASSARQH